MGEVYFFSGTGNSLVVARELAQRLGARLLPLDVVASGNDEAPILTASDLIGIVFRVCYTTLPPIVRFFAPLCLR